MSCETCYETIETDGVEPPCFTETGCWLPPLPEGLQRIFEIRDRLVTLHELVDAGTILRLYDADIEDIELLAVIEGELKALSDSGEETGGDGYKKNNQTGNE